MHLSRFRPHFTVRRLMVVVAIAAIPCWMMERNYRFHRLAEHHRSKAGYLGFASGSGKLTITSQDGMPMSQDSYDWHEMLEAKYDRAARYPWLPVAPDPPEPE